MQFRVTKCCYCFDLRYGFYTFGILSMIFRVAAITSVWGTMLLAVSILQARSGDNSGIVAGYSTIVSLTTPAIGYIISTSIVLLITLRGIALERSVLIYPYIVVVVLEIIVAVIFNIWATAMLTPIFLINLIITVAIEGYILLCLWSLYKVIGQREESLRPILSTTFTNEQAFVDKP